jgi:hypothetical protein
MRQISTKSGLRSTASPARSASAELNCSRLVAPFRTRRTGSEAIGPICWASTRCNRCSSLAHSIRPVHTLTDGGALFTRATGGSGKPGDMTVLVAMVAEVTARAVLNAVRVSAGLPGLPTARKMGVGG